MTYVVGVRGPDEYRWCQCGHHMLEKIGVYSTGRHHADGSTVYEYSHMPACPVCADKERLGGIATGAGVV